ncbi:hypothetical protein [Micromonospora sp. DT227]|uniref:hypothetical protein n=1 Tax=Micromonospora sp. DT227 TaxID=3393433 RepID=UPI003CECDD81
MQTDLATDQKTATTDAPGPNDLLPCGTDSARRRHLARNEQCTLCGVEDGRRMPAAGPTA